MPKFYSRSYNNSPQDGYVLSTDSNGFVSWTSSTTGTSSYVTGGVGLTVSGSMIHLSSTNNKIIYVSVNGDDLNSGLNELLPKRTLKAARDQAVYGDTVYVLPGLFLFDNTNGIYDSNLDDVNLWKDGVTYYWSPGCKLKTIAKFNQPGTTIYLFKPNNSVYETCASVGYLEYEQYEDANNGGAWGNCLYFWYPGTTTGTDYGCTFYSQTKSQIGQGGEMFSIGRGNSTNTSSIFDITIISDYEYNKWLPGLSGTSMTYTLLGSTASDLPMKIRSVVKDRDNSNNSFLTIRNMWGPSSYVYFAGETLKQNGWTTGSKFLEPRITSTVTVNVDIKKMYMSTSNPSQGLVVADLFNSASLGTIFNIKGDLIASYASGVNMPIFSLVYNTTVNYDGNIYTNNQGNVGNIVAYVASSTSVANIRGNIHHPGVTTVTNPTFKTNSGGLIKYTGNITGNFSNTIALCGSGTIEISNSNIKSTATSSTSYLLSNGGSSLGVVKINNSYIEINNSTNPFGNGAYINAFINNSTIVNSGSASGISNSTNFGSLQIVNSFIYAMSAPVNYSGTASVIVSNTTTNATWSASNIVGNVDLITNLSF